MLSVRSAHETLVSRSELQFRELRRQVERLGEICRMAGRTRGASVRTTERVRMVVERQGEMIKRADVMLKRVVESQDEQGSVEVRAAWSKELARMKADVWGIHGEGGLVGRSEQVRTIVDPE